MLPINRFKQQLKQPQTLWGLWLGLPDTSCAEICGSAGFDWVLIDGEHASFDLTSIKLHLQGIDQLRKLLARGKKVYLIAIGYGEVLEIFFGCFDDRISKSKRKSERQ